jgi:NADH dehydrogenase FAD-containing subunit
VTEHAMFLKELWDARAIRHRIIANVQASTFPGV